MLGLVTRGITAEPMSAPQLWHSGHDTREAVGARDMSLTRTRGLMDADHKTGRGVKSALEKLRRLGLWGPNQGTDCLARPSPGWLLLAFHGAALPCVAEIHVVAESKREQVPLCLPLCWLPNCHRLAASAIVDGRINMILLAAYVETLGKQQK